MDPCPNEKKELQSLSEVDKETIDKLDQLEKTLSRSSFTSGDMISTEDVTACEDLEALSLDIPNEKYPKLVKWMKEINRMKLNWKISKRPNKGRTFCDYIQKSQKKINEQNEQYNHELLNQTNQSKGILLKSEEEKAIATIHFHPKKDSGFQIKIRVKFLPNKDSQGLSLSEVSSKLAIVTHSYLPNKTDIKPNKNEKDELTAEIVSIIDNEDWDIEPLAKDLKRNVNGVFNVEITSITKL